MSSSDRTRADSLLSELRAATHAQHAALDSLVLPSDGSLTQARYAALLLGSLAVLTRLEERLAGWFPDYRELSRKACLEADLTALQVEVRLPEIAVPELPTLAAAYGCAYVIEGSALGGLMMAKTVRSQLGLGEQQLRYLTLRGDATRPHFRAFCERLAAFGADAPAEQRAIACRCASATFDAYAHGIRAAQKILDSSVFCSRAEPPASTARPGFDP